MKEVIRSVIDLVTYADVAAAGDFIDLPSLTPPSAENWKTRLMRYHFSLPTHELTSEVILEKELEFPRLDDRLDGKPYRYLYLTLTENNTVGLVKVDLETKEIVTFMDRAWEQMRRTCFHRCTRCQTGR